MTMLLAFAVLTARAQAGKFFDIDHLRSGLFINQLYIDRNGFLWAVTSNGIVQYDGYQFQVFKRGQKNAAGMGNNHVLCMAQARNGLFYFGTYANLQVYDGVQFRDVKKLNGKGESVYGNVNCLFERKNGELVAGTSTDGLLLVKNDGTARQMNIKLPGCEEIRSMAEDNAGRLWIVNRGLFRKQGEQFVHVAETGNIPVPALYTDHTGNLLVGFDGKGMSIYNPLTGELTANSYYSHEVELSKSKVYAIIEDGNENVWLGLSEKGIFQQPPSSSGFRYMGHKAGAMNVIGTANICCVFADSKANTWLGTDKDGIYCLDKDGHLVRHYAEGFPSTVLTISEDAEGRIWIGSYGEGGGWIDPRTSQYHPVKSQQNNFLSITDYAMDSQGRIWAGTMGQGLLMFTKGGQEIRQYRSTDGTGKGLS